MDIKEKFIDTFKNTEFTKWRLKADIYLGDKEKAKGLVRRAMMVSTLENKGYLSGIWDKLMLTFELARDWANGTYRIIPKGSIALIFIGLVYFVSPADMIPDILTPIGFLDDATILSFIFRQVSRDLEAYKLWKGFKEIRIEPGMKDTLETNNEQ